MEISKHFFDSYLTAGQTYDNFVLTNCGLEFMRFARNSLSESKNGVRPINVVFSDKEEKSINATFCFLDKLLSKTIARDYVCAKIYMEMIKDNPEYSHKYKRLENGINAVLNGDLDNAIGFGKEAPMPYELTQMARKIGKIELNLFLYNVEDNNIQQAINNFLSCREPYSIKVFANKDRFCTNYDQMGNLIQPPHDYMTRDVRNFIASVKSI